MLDALPNSPGFDWTGQCGLSAFPVQSENSQADLSPVIPWTEAKQILTLPLLLLYIKEFFFQVKRWEVKLSYVDSVPSLSFTNVRVVYWHLYKKGGLGVLPLKIWKESYTIFSILFFFLFFTGGWSMLWVMIFPKIIWKLQAEGTDLAPTPNIALL